MTGDRGGIPRRRKQAQVLDDPSSRGRAPAAKVNRGEEPASSTETGATDIRVEDLGNGRARLSVELSWPLTLKILDLLKDSGDQRNH